MPPQQNQPDPFGSSPSGELPAPQVPEQPAAPTPNLARPTAAQGALPPAGYTPAPIPQAGVPKLHPENIQQDFPAPDALKKEDNRYAFFMESKPKEQKSLIPKKSNTLAWVIIIGVIVFTVLGITGAFLTSSRNSKNNGNADTLVSIINQQQEIIRVTKSAATTLQSTDLINFTSTANVTMTSSQQELVQYATDHGVKIDSKALATVVADPKTDEVLKSAQAASVYDTTYRRIMLELVTKYQDSLQSVAGRAELKSEKDIVLKNIQYAELLHNQIAID